MACRYAADISEPDKRKCADALYHSAEIYYSDRLYSLAMNQYLEALKLSERHSYPLLTTQIYMGIGNLYSSNGDYEMGIRFYKQADSIACSSVKAKVVRNRVLNNLIGATCFVGRISEAEKYLLALQQNKENTPEYHFNELMCKGLILNFKGFHQKALDYYRSALSYAGRNKLGDACLEAVNSCVAQISLISISLTLQSSILKEMRINRCEQEIQTCWLSLSTIFLKPIGRRETLPRRCAIRHAMWSFATRFTAKESSMQ